MSQEHTPSLESLFDTEQNVGHESGLELECQVDEGDEPGTESEQELESPFSLQQELQALRQWKEDTTRFLKQESTSAQASPELSREQLQQLMATDPVTYHEYVVNQAVQRMNHQTEMNQLVREFSAKYPEMVPFKDYIVEDARQMAWQMHQEGKPVDDRKVIESAIGALKHKIMEAKQYSKGQTLQRMALKLDATGTQPPKKMTGDDIWNMSSEKFAEFDKEIARKLYGY